MDFFRFGDVYFDCFGVDLIVIIDVELIRFSVRYEREGKDND